MKNIRFGEIEITVTECYPYTYSDGKEVLKLSTKDSDYKTISKLEDFVGTIEYYEDDILVCEYKNYSADFTCHFYKGKWTIDLTRVDKVISDLETAKSDLEIARTEMADMLSTIDVILTEVIPSMGV